MFRFFSETPFPNYWELMGIPTLSFDSKETSVTDSQLLEEIGRFL